MNFTGISAASPVPPDTHIAVGPGVGAAGRVVMVTNAGVQLWNKSGVSIAGPISLVAMFGAGPTAFDPKVLFDQHSGRFFIVVFRGPGSPVTSTIALAVSTTGAPGTLGAGDWTFLSGSGSMVIGGTPTWADYPCIGADASRLCITTNQFSTAGTFTGSNIRVFNTVALLGGAYTFGDITYDAAGPEFGVFTIQPAHVCGTTPGAAGSR